MLNKPKKTEFLGIRCTKEIIEKLQALSEKTDRSISWIVNEAIKEYLKKWDNSL